MNAALSPISKTALWTAAARACETQRADALFRDPFATALAGREGFEWFDYFTRVQPGSTAPNPYLAIRTRFFDDFVLHVSHNAGIKQLVFVAAGLDTRAARLSFPSDIRVFEVDYPEVLEQKELILDHVGARSSCERHVVGVDLMRHWEDALLEATYDVQLPSLWLLEGVLVYLDQSAVRNLLEQVKNLAAPRSWLGADVVNTAFLLSPFLKPWLLELAKRDVPWRFGTDDPETFFEAHGWRAQVTQPGEEGADFDRWPYPVASRAIPGVPRSFLIRARNHFEEVQ